MLFQKFSIAGFSVAKQQGCWQLSNNRCNIKGKNVQSLVETLIFEEEKDDSINEREYQEDYQTVSAKEYFS